jgi:ferredoxin
VAVCGKIQSINAINKINRGFETQVGTAYNKPMIDSPCVGCGQCTLVCPTGALTENTDIRKVEEYLSDPSIVREEYEILSNKYRPDQIALDYYGDSSYEGLLILQAACPLSSFTEGTILYLIPKATLDSILSNL